MFTPETIAFLEGGCSWIVGTVSPEGEPTASRAWGMTVLSAADRECRVLLDASATQTLDDLAQTGVIAMTSADVPTLRAIQLKGVVVGLEPATEADRVRAADYCGAFFGDVAKTDGTDPAVIARMAPREFSVCVVRIRETYDQTPGPTAGVELAGSGI